MEPGVVLVKEQHPELSKRSMGVDNIPYGEAIGSVLWAAMISQPNIAYAVGVLSQFIQKLDNLHWEALKCVIVYLGSTKDLSLTFVGLFYSFWSSTWRLIVLRSDTGIINPTCQAKWHRSSSFKTERIQYTYINGRMPCMWRTAGAWQKLGLKPRATVQLNWHDMASYNEGILLIGVWMDGIRAASPSGLSKTLSIIPTLEVRSKSGRWGWNTNLHVNGTGLCWVHICILPSIQV